MKTQILVPALISIMTLGFWGNAEAQHCPSPVGYNRPGGCYRDEQVWRDGYWTTDGWGRRIYVDGRWEWVRVSVPCNVPPPPPPPPPRNCRPRYYGPRWQHNSNNHPGWHNDRPQSRHNDRPAYNGPRSEAKPALQPTIYDGIVARIKSQNFDEDRLKLSIQLTSGYALTCNQTRGIMDSFGFESSRLSFAKAVVPYVLDAQNIATVYEGFRFRSSVAELEQHLAQYHNPNS